jgi:16S rRNA G527 N7-methylase RsmG
MLVKLGHKIKFVQEVQHISYIQNVKELKSRAEKALLLKTCPHVTLMIVNVKTL